MQKPQTIKNYEKYKSVFIKVITNPYVISFIIAIVIIITLPLIFNKYKIETIQRNKIEPNLVYYYADFNNDGVSEKIEIMQIQKDFFSLTIFDNNKVIDQWNFEGKFLTTSKLIVSKIGNNRFKSIYFFLFKNNKIYLNCLNPFENRFITKDKFVIDFIPKTSGLDCGIFPHIFYDSNKDGTNEFYFSCNVGYSIQPRRVCKYDPANDTLYLSSESSASVTISAIDTTGNELKIIFASDAVGNSKLHDPYSDMFAWLLCFDEYLSFKYEPVIIGFYPSNSNIISIIADDKKYFVCLNIYTGIEKHQCSLLIFSSELELIKEKKFSFTPEWFGASLYASNEQNCFYIIKNTGQVEKFDSDLNIMSQNYILPLSNIIPFSEDVDEDNEDELIFFSKDVDKLIVTRNDFSSYVFANIAGIGNIRSYSLKLNDNGPRELVVSSDKEELTLLYQFNYLYYLRYPVYAGVYFLILLLILLIQKAQKHRAELKYETEKRIAELQLKAIKNQIDPHFTLNIINSIGSLFYKQDREKADYVFGKYSKLLRQTILNSDKILTTLSDELDYVENYLELEKFRNGSKFCWKTDIIENTNLNIKIPKMLIHTFVENAIKHGLKHLEGNGELFISVYNNNKEYQIIIRDNGIGRKKAKKNEDESTGKGLIILEQILDLYYNLMKIRITYTVKDLVDENENALGTEVLIKIPVDKT